MVRFFGGYVQVKLWGGETKRVLNLCAARNLFLWNIQEKEDCIFLYMELASFYKLPAILKKTRTRAVVTKRIGLPFLLPKLKEKSVFLIGMTLAFVFWMISSFFIWEITLEGNEQITKEQLSDYLSENNIYKGMPKYRLQVEDLEKGLRNHFPKITWISGKVDGTKLILSLKENTGYEMTRKKTDSMGTDLTAKQDATVLSILVRSGIPAVKVGDRVSSGDILVQGIIPIPAEDGNIRKYLYVDADADIRGQRVRQYYSTLPMSYVRKEYTGRRKELFFFRIGKTEFVLGIPPKYKYYEIVTEETGQKSLFAGNLSVRRGKKQYLEYNRMEYYYTKEQVEHIFEGKLAKFIESLIQKGVQIIGKDDKIEKNTTEWRYTVALFVVEDLGQRAAAIREVNE